MYTVFSHSYIAQWLKVITRDMFHFNKTLKTGKKTFHIFELYVLYVGEILLNMSAFETVTNSLVDTHLYGNSILDSIQTLYTHSVWL